MDIEAFSDSMSAFAANVMVFFIVSHHLGLCPAEKQLRNCVTIRHELLSWCTFLLFDLRPSFIVSLDETYLKTLQQVFPASGDHSTSSSSSATMSEAKRREELDLVQVTVVA